jgi:hypothetical protein
VIDLGLCEPDLKGSSVRTGGGTGPAALTEYLDDLGHADIFIDHTSFVGTDLYADAAACTDPFVDLYGRTRRVDLILGQQGHGPGGGSGGLGDRLG